METTRAHSRQLEITSREAEARLRNGLTAETDPILLVAADFNVGTDQAKPSVRAEIWGLQSASELAFAGATEAVLDLRIIGASGAIYGDSQHPVQVPATTATSLLTAQIEIPPEPLWIVELTLWIPPSLISASTRYLLPTALPAAPDFPAEIPQTTIDVRRLPEAGLVLLTNTGSYAAFYVEVSRLNGATPAWIHLLAGETRSVALDGAEEALKPLSDRIHVTALNAIVHQG
jgi:hypothetical protein